ncbi:hypothetical protein [Gimesia maris]|uniref:DUF1877 domain-containing protein n=1 Tax=Gimesia maris TaxID=122 RepID=A0ABX5YM34_9PLAN|nr:hypothetical protein [Gimesia maris]EDL59795.1 hypothetical protein PM8797T_31443 [Gimesia maris DSM 8797]QEG16714.1 hypothetical protein GmarT_25810 [Gimesia maris]QGQ30127.1 hypothetical protein F1729_16555 [Gimesia maris]
MSTGLSGFSIDLERIRNFEGDEAKEYINLILEEMKREEGLSPEDEGSKEFLEAYKDYELNLEYIFGIINQSNQFNSLPLTICWKICDLFGTELDTEVYSMPPIRDLGFKTSKLNGSYNTPFGFSPGDENIGYLTLEEIQEERKQLKGCLQESFEQASDIIWMLNPQQIEEEKEEWNNIILPARKTYLDWLDYCIREGTDLLIIET